MSSSIADSVYHGGFVRQAAPERPGLMVTRCATRKTTWYAWAQSSQWLQIAELSHCQACPIAEQCPHAHIVFHPFKPI